METICYGVREIQARIGEALGLVAAGKRVLVTKRGKAVALLCAPTEGPPETESAEETRLRRLAATGRLLLGSGRPGEAFPVVALRGLARQLEEDPAKLDSPTRPARPRRRKPRR